MKDLHRLATLAVVATFTACADPAGPPLESASIVQITNGGVDSSTVPGYTGNSRISGRVLSVTRKNVSSGNDTLQYTPIAGATVTLKRNLLVNGTATQVTVGTAVTNAQGAYAFGNGPGGYYVAYASGPVGQGWASSYSLVLANSPEVSADIYLWKE
jgi:hypothetical protein